MAKLTFKKTVSIILCAIIFVCAFGMLCEYHTAKFSSFVWYYVGLALTIGVCSFLVWYIQDIKHSNKVLKAIATVLYIYFIKYRLLALGWVEYKIKWFKAAAVFAYEAKKDGKSMKWIIHHIWKIKKD